MKRLTPTLLGLLTALALLSAACGPSETDSAGSEPPADTAPLVDPPSTTSGRDTTPRAQPEPTPLRDVDLDLDLVATMPTPVAMTTIPGIEDRVWVAARDGQLFEIDLEEGGEGTPVLDFSDDVSTSGEQGFLGVAVAPDGGHLYTSYTDPDGATRIDEYTLDGVGIDEIGIEESSRRQVLGLPQPFSNHNGGNIVFGPDGLLYLGLGDGGSFADPDGNVHEFGGKP